MSYNTGLNLKDHYSTITSGSRDFTGGIPAADRNIWQGYTTEPIEFSKELAEWVKLETWQGLNSPHPVLYQVSPGLTKLVGNECKRFIVALDGYYKSANPVLPKSFLIEGITDINFCTTLKKIRTYSWIRSYRMSPMEHPEDFHKYPKYSIKDIGDIFNYRYWFFWKEEPAGDYKHHFIPLNKGEVNSENEDLFKSALRSILPKSVQKVEEEEILLANSSSSCLTSDYTAKSKVFKEKEKGGNKFSTEPLYGKLTYAHKGPCEVRECITLSVPQSNSVKLIDKQVMEVVSDIPYSAHLRDPEDFENKIQRFFNKNRFFLNRDLTKEGMMKPRYLLMWMLEVLEERFPLLPAWKYKGIFKNLTLEVDGVPMATTRGHGLGMANALTTLMQCVIFKVITDSENVYFLREGGLSAMFYNDDGTIGSENENTLYTYAEEEKDILEKFNLVRKESKTYRGETAVICEQFSNKTLNKKESYKRYIQRLVFAACNVVHAKSLSDVLWNPSNGKPDPYLTSKLIPFFGYEFDANEHEVVSSCGGWFNPIYKGVRLDCLYLKSDFLHSKGVLIGKPNPKPRIMKRTADRLYNDPLTQWLGPELDLRGFNSEFRYKLSLKEVTASFTRNYNRSIVEDYLNRERIRRFNLFQVRLERSLTIDEIYMKVVENHPYTDFLPPPESCYKMKREKQIERIGERTPMRPANPILSGIKILNPGKTFDKLISWPYVPGMSFGEKSLTASQREDFKTFITTDLYQDSDIRPLGTLTPWEDCIYKKHPWVNTYDVIDAYVSVTGDYETFPWPKYLSEMGKIRLEHSEHINMYEGTNYRDLPNVISNYGEKVIKLLISNPLFQEEYQLELAREENIQKDNLPSFSKEKYHYQLDHDSFIQWRWNTDMSAEGIPWYIFNIFHGIHDIVSTSDLFIRLNEGSFRKDLTYPEMVTNSLQDFDLIMPLLIKIGNLEVFDFKGITLYRYVQHSIWDDEQSDEGDPYGLWPE